MGVQSLSVLPMPPPRELAYTIADFRQMHRNAEQMARQKTAVEEAAARTLEAAGKRPKDKWVLDEESGAYVLVQRLPPGLDVVASNGPPMNQDMVSFDDAAGT